jgi:hypothetical protein
VRPTGGPIGRVSRWLNGRDWWSWDLLVGVIAAAAVAGGALLYPKVRGEGGPTYLYALAAAFVAMLGVVMAVMAILIGLMSPSYRAILEAIPGGIRRAMHPYFIVVFGSAVGAFIALVGALGWPAMTWWAKVVTLSVASGMVAWLLTGSAQLLLVTFNHGADSHSIDKHQAAIRAAREERLKHLNG